jgi:hypothetical protein
MTSIAKIYQERRKRNKDKYDILKENGFDKEGYGYIKRVVGILPSELELPTYNSKDI